VTAHDITRNDNLEAMLASPVFTHVVLHGASQIKSHECLQFAVCALHQDASSACSNCVFVIIFWMLL